MHLHVMMEKRETLTHASIRIECLFVYFAPFLVNRSALEGDCGFLAANLYAKSVFGEEALVNLSIEKQGDSNPFLLISSVAF